MKLPCIRIAARVAALTLVGVFPLLSGCGAREAEGFAIYLTKAETPPAQMALVSHVELAEPPLVATSDILAYGGSTHEITLAKSAFERIANLDVPVWGRTFVVAVGKRPIYAGAFWTPASSASFDGVIILKPAILAPAVSGDARVVKLELGYPSPSFFKDEDPRAKAEIIESLKNAGKLK